MSMANEILQPEEAWRFCDVCDPHRTCQFSAERAYNKHRTSQGHLKASGQPLRNVPCPECGKLLSRTSAIQRHLNSGQCPGRKSAINAIPEPSRKHALSVSPNGIAWKIQKTAASDFSVGATSPHPSVAPSADHSPRPSHKLISPDPRSGSRLCNDPVRPLNFAPSSQPSKVPTGSTVSHDTITETLTTSPLNLPHAAPVRDTSSCNHTLRTGLKHRHQERWTNHVDHDLHVISEERSPSSPRSNGTPIKSTSPSNNGDETEQWLSVTMQSASLKDNDLSYLPMQGILSSTPVDSMGSLGSLFLLCTPRTAVPEWVRLPLSLISPLTYSSVRSAEMPAPILTGPVDEELRTSRSRSTKKDQPTSAPIQIPELRNGNEDLIKQISSGRHGWASKHFIEVEIDNQWKVRDSEMHLWCAAVRW